MLGGCIGYYYCYGNGSGNFIYFGVQLGFVCVNGKQGWFVGRYFLVQLVGFFVVCGVL